MRTRDPQRAFVGTGETRRLSRAQLASLVVALASFGCGCDESPKSLPHRPAARVAEQPQPAVPAADRAGVAIERRLQAALAAKGAGYVPRTRHTNADGSAKYTNRLLLESSPYLLQHAHNPVDWYPWGEEAFERARTLGRPVFLSVGYSTCHWCHVMEEESFEDEEIARYLNEHYVAIKVDREERPDVDAVYMAFVQGITGGGGWPMSVWMTPSREPFFGGTYFPPRTGARGARRGFLEILREQSDRFAADREGVASAAKELAGRLQERTAPEPAGDFPSTASLTAARLQASRSFDPELGGRRGAPKFPSSFPVRLLLRMARRAGDTDARRMALTTLERMRTGGIRDQIGGGFHRYSTDAAWLVPHFEMMLYDNALLALAYLEAGQASGEPAMLAAAREVLDYVLRDMTSPDGTFYSATDADSAGPDGRREEGLYFTWTPAELEATLGAEDARVAAAWFGVSKAGNFEGRSILTTMRATGDVARELGMEQAALEARLPPIRANLLEARALRAAPLRDEKVIVAWNGLAISAFARAAIVLGDARYGAAAVRAATALARPLRAGRLLPHVFADGREQGSAFADDHVLLANALLDVFELTSDVQWLDDAIRLMDELEASFSDRTNGGYYLTAERHERLLFRDKPDYDGPVPSVSSVAALVWLRLNTLTDDARFLTPAEMTLRAFAGVLASRPLALEHMLLALDWASDSPREIAVIVPEGAGALAPAARPLLDVLARTFAPNAVLVVATKEEAEAMALRIPWLRGKVMRDGRATAYVCEQGTCKQPTIEPAVLASQLAEARPYR